MCLSIFNQTIQKQSNIQKGYNNEYEVSLTAT